MSCDRTEPLEFYVGDTVAWNKALDDYDSSTDDLVYEFSGKNFAATYDDTSGITANPDGSWDIKINPEPPPGGTNYWSEDTYQWRAVVTTGAGDVFTVDTGFTQVHPKLDVAADRRTFLEKSIENIEAVIEGRASEDVSSWSIQTGTGGRTLAKMLLSELLDARDRFKAELQQLERVERAKCGKTHSGQIFVRF